MNTLVLIRLLLDGGLVVLIWMIQIVVYPSFLYYESENLVKWHKEYTSRFSFIVMPLMLGQLGIGSYQFFLENNFYNLTSLVIISLLWIVTFSHFVPIHTKLSKGMVNEQLLLSLIKKNWIRTLLWTLLFVYSFYHTISLD